MRKFFNFDWWLFLPAFLLLIFSLTMVASVAAQLLSHQLFFAFLGLVIFVVFANIDFVIWEKMSGLVFLGSLIFLITPFLFGTITRGSLRWLRIGDFTLQPSELTKPFLIIFFASTFAQENEINLGRLFKNGLFLGVPLFLIFSQPDLGSSLVVFFTWVGVILAAETPWRLIILGMIALLVFLPIGWRWFLQDYQRQRLVGFLSPSKDPLGAGYHLIQAKVAVGSGQLFGRGWGRGTQSQLDFLPERHTDFIFASLCEELGFFGAGLVIGIFVFLFWRILIVARNSESCFGFVLCLGIFSLLFTQVVINLGMNLGMLPITGIPLPLVSYGGSSLLTTMICLGIVANISVARKPYLY